MNTHRGMTNGLRVIMRTLLYPEGIAFTKTITLPMRSTVSRSKTSPVFLPVRVRRDDQGSAHLDLPRREPVAVRVVRVAVIFDVDPRPSL
jgi:hypothetical protein